MITTPEAPPFASLFDTPSLDTPKDSKSSESLTFEVLYHHGGVYIDFDMRLTSKMEVAGCCLQMLLMHTFRALQSWSIPSKRISHALLRVSHSKGKSVLKTGWSEVDKPRVCKTVLPTHPTFSGWQCMMLMRLFSA